MAFVRPGPKAKTASRARISEGNANNTSMIRINTSSTRPPIYPAKLPTMTPMVRAMLTDTSPSRSEIREPKITRLSMSRPSVSVPIQCSVDGGSKASNGETANGSKGATCGANTAITMSENIRRAPSTPPRWRRKRLSSFREGLDRCSMDALGSADRSCVAMASS